MSVQNGDVVILQIGGVQLGALVSNSQNMTADMLEKNSKDIPGIKAYDAGEDGWGLSVEALWDPAATEGFSEALGYLKAGTEITVKHGIAAGDNWTGTGLVSSVDVAGPKNEISSYSLEIQGTGFQYGPELHIDANAASDPNGNEADTTTGWTPTGLSGTGANVFESQSSVVNTGTYALHADANDTPTSGANFVKTFTVESGATYRVTVDARHIGSGGAWWGFADGNQVCALSSSDTTFASFSLSFVAGSGSIEVKFQEVSGTDNGGVYADNISLRKRL